MCICFVSSTHAKTQSKMQAKEKKIADTVTSSNNDSLALSSADTRLV